MVWVCAPLHGAPRTGLWKGCWLLMQVSPASCGGPAWGDSQLPNQAVLPGSSPGSGRGPCAAVGKLEVVCASWLWLQAGAPLLVPALPLTQSTKAWLGQAMLSSLVTQHLIPPHAAGPHSIAFPWQCRGYCHHYAAEGTAIIMLQSVQSERELFLPLSWQGQYCWALT